MSSDPAAEREALREHKRLCLFDEHQSLSSFVEREISFTAATRNCCIAVWTLLLAATMLSGVEPSGLPCLMLLVVIAAFYLVDFFYSYFGVIYKMRRLQVRQWINQLPDADLMELQSWSTPANPFDGLTRSDKLRALRDTAKSPVVLAVYGLLAVATALLQLLS